MSETKIIFRLQFLHYRHYVPKIPNDSDEGHICLHMIRSSDLAKCIILSGLLRTSVPTVRRSPESCRLQTKISA